MRRLFLTAMLAVITAVPIQAQQIITESQFLEVLKPDHPAVIAGSDRLAAAEADERRARLLDNPRLEFSQEAPEDNPRVTNWMLNWTPPFDGRRGPRIKAAQAGVEAARNDMAFRNLELRRQLRTIFADWAMSVERQKTITAHLDLIQDLGGQMRARATRGEESQLAACRIGLAALEIRAELVRAEAEALGTGARARVWAPDADTTLEPVLPSLPPLPDAVTVADRPDLVALRYEMEQAEHLVRAGGRFLRFPEISFGWQKLTDETASSEGPLLGVSVGVPLFNRDQGDRHESRGRLAAARARAGITLLNAEAEFAGNLEAYNRLRSGALESQEAAREADRVIESAAASYRLGESRLTDLLETLRSALTARLAALDLYSRALEAHRDLESAAGRPLSPDGGSR